MHFKFVFILCIHTLLYMYHTYRYYFNNFVSFDAMQFLDLL